MAATLMWLWGGRKLAHVWVGPLRRHGELVWLRRWVVLQGRRGRVGLAPMRLCGAVGVPVEREEDFAWPGLLIVQLHRALEVWLVHEPAQIDPAVTEWIVSRAEVVVPRTHQHWLGGELAKRAAELEVLVPSRVERLLYDLALDGLLTDGELHVRIGEAVAVHRSQAERMAEVNAQNSRHENFDLSDEEQ